jgi:hypothetical protein
MHIRERWEQMHERSLWQKRAGCLHNFRHAPAEQPTERVHVAIPDTATLADHSSWRQHPAAALVRLPAVESGP